MYPSAQRAQSAAEQGKLAEELHEHEGLLGELTGMCTDLREMLLLPPSQSGMVP